MIIAFSCSKTNHFYNMSGNKINAPTIDANRPFKEIVALSDGVADEHF